MRSIMYPALPVLLFITTGCCKTIPVMPDPVACTFPKATLEDSCEEPVNIGDGVTYSDLISASIADRNSLRKCSAHDRLLRKSIQECSAELERYRVRIQEVNERYGSRP
jgi:hypothetical protein